MALIFQQTFVSPLGRLLFKTYFILRVAMGNGFGLSSGTPVGVVAVQVFSCLQQERSNGPVGPWQDARRLCATVLIIYIP